MNTIMMIAGDLSMKGQLVKFITLLITSFFLTTTAAVAQTQLYMAEEDGCLWCERWHKEIGDIYPKTSEGKVAPLVPYDLHDEIPPIELATTVHFTPTFILVQDGIEIDRLEGYPGEDFFWGLLGMMLEKAKIRLEPTG